LLGVYDFALPKVLAVEYTLVMGRPAKVNNVGRSRLVGKFEDDSKEVKLLAKLQEDSSELKFDINPEKPQIKTITVWTCGLWYLV